MQRPTRQYRRPHAQRPLRCERLETRQLFATDLLASDGESSVGQVQDEAISVEPLLFAMGESLPVTASTTDGMRPWNVDDLVRFYRNSHYPNWAAPKIESLTSEAALVERLREQAAEYWSGLLGQSLSEKMAPWSDVRILGNGFPNPIVCLYSGWGTGEQRLDDVVVAEDHFIYAIRDQRVVIIDARDPTNLQTVSRIDLNAWSNKLFVADNRLIVVSTLSDETATQQGEQTLVYRYPNTPPRTQVQVFDISTRNQPQSVSTFVIDDSSVIDAQMQNGQLLLALSRSIQLPAPQVVGKGSDARFETVDEYLARVSDQLLGAYLTHYQQGTSATELGEKQTLGDWQDIALLAPGASGTLLLQLDVVGAQPSMLGCELLTGVGLNTFAIGHDSIYAPLNIESNAVIYRIRRASDGQLDLDGSATVKGNVFSSQAMNVKDGVLRVVSWFYRSEENQAANLTYVTTLGDVHGTWQTLGTFDDIGDAKYVFSVAFEGDRAIIIAANPNDVSQSQSMHVIDLSDAEHPHELGRADLPDYTNILLRIDAGHWLGIGYMLDNGERRMQLSLVDVSNPSQPRLMDSWTEKSSADGQSVLPWWGWDAASLTYDSVHGLVSLGTSRYMLQSEGNFPNGSVLFAVDVAADDPLKLLDHIDHPEAISRELVIGDYVVTLSANAVVSHRINDLSGAAVDWTPLPFDRSRTVYAGYPILPGETKTVPLLGRWKQGLYEIISVKTEGPIKITATEDQQLFIDARGVAIPIEGQRATVRVRYVDGQEGTFQVTVAETAFTQPFPPTDPAVDPLPLSSATASIDAHLEDDQGQTITTPAVGDVVWVVVSVQDTRAVPQGVFGAYVDVNFISANMSVVGEPEHLGEFVNGKSGRVSASGIKNLGGFTSNTTAPGNGNFQALARFQVRITADGPLDYTIAPANGVGQEFLLFGENARLPEANIQKYDSRSSTLQRNLDGLDHAMDINADGIVSALDVLLVINRLNAAADARIAVAATRAPTDSGPFDAEKVTPFIVRIEAVASDRVFDLDADGNLSFGDVSMIIDAINTRKRSR